ncbi:peptidylprolyl isomerase [Flavobacteriaceae bacterium R38]|nr:peptidylprolyl isomerase [Flavobacteriaceae bacterium R38]
MAILESIRKRSLFLILVIGLALFAFIISGIFTQGGGLDTTKSIVGKVNDASIAREDFVQKVENASRSYGTNFSTIQVVNQVWNSEVRSALLEQQFEKLGLSIERDQIINVIASNPAFASDPTFQNEFGVFDEGRFIEFIADLKANNPLGYQQWQLQEENLVNSAKEQMYFNLIKAGVGSTAKEGELNYQLENDKVAIKFVRVPYSSIPDSTITVTKRDVQNYINEHKDLYKEDESRDIQYVFFEEKPSLEDENKVRDDLNALIEKETNNEGSLGFRNTTDVEAFVDRNSNTKYLDKYLFKDQLNAAVADSIFNLEIGDVYGAYKDEASYKLSRVLAKTRIADSVKSSYILVPYVGSLAANATTTKTEEEAKKTIDSIFSLVRNDREKFTEIADTINQDATRGNGGDLGWIRYSQISDDTFDRDFSNFMFFNDKDAIGVVKTKFGFHVIRIDDQADFKDAVKLGTIEKRIEPSEGTINELFTTTTKYEIEVNEKDFQEVATANNYVVRPVNKIKELDENLPGLGQQRSVVQWAFSDEAKVGDIRRFDLNNGYAVVRLTGKTKEGLATVEDVSSRIVPIIRRQRKAEMIRNKSNATSLEDFATQNGVTISTASALNMNSAAIAGAGREPKVLGAAFGLEEGATSGLIDGENAVFMVQVTKKEAALPLDNYGTYTLSQKTKNRNGAINAAFNALRKAADIEDNRATFY